MMIIELIIIMINLFILALNLKLYTEILKDKSQDKRLKREAK